MKIREFLSVCESENTINVNIMDTASGDPAILLIKFGLSEWSYIADKILDFDVEKIDINNENSEETIIEIYIPYGADPEETDVTE